MAVENISVGDKYSGYLQIRSVSLRQTRSGDPYMFVKAGDITADLTVKIWSINKELADTLVNNSVGGFLKVENIIAGEYQGMLELTSKGGKGIEFVSKDDMEKNPDFKLSDYCIGAPFRREDMLSEIKKDIKYEITNKEVRKLVQNIFDENYEKFQTQPAAISIHHDYEEGLLYHTYNMLRVAKELSKLYPFINKSLLLAGVILHDMGKLIEYYKDEDTGGYDYSKEGNLVGHISLMSAEIYERGHKLGISDEVILNLQHLVLSHHGNLEWGSPVVPKTAEAILLHYIDNIDAKMEQIRSATNGVEPGNMTNRIFGLGNVQIYVPDLEEGPEDKKDIKKTEYFQMGLDDLSL